MIVDASWTQLKLFCATWTQLTFFFFWFGYFFFCLARSVACCAECWLFSSNPENAGCVGETEISCSSLGKTLAWREKLEFTVLTYGAHSCPHVNCERTSYFVKQKATFFFLFCHHQTFLWHRNVSRCCMKTPPSGSQTQLSRKENGQSTWRST
jgi:hypothetical protein